MKKSVRIFCTLLSLILLLTCMSLLNACKKETPQPDAPGTDGSEEPTATTPPATDEDLPHSRVPEGLTFPGESVKILLRPNMIPEFKTEYSGAVIDNALYTRNSKVEEDLKVELKYDPRSVDGGSEADGFKGYKAFLRNASKNDDTYDIVTMYSYYMAPLASEGIYYNLLSADEKNYVSPDLAWYNQTFVSEVALKDRLYFIIGDATLSATEMAVLTFFNINELYRADANLTAEDLYQVALDGDWTLEYLKNLVTDVYADMNGDGQTADDFYGLSLNNGAMCLDSLVVGVGIDITERDEAGNISFAFQGYRSKTAYAAVYNLMYNTSSGVFLGSAKNGYYDADGTSECRYYAEQMFSEGRAMFAFGMLKSAQQYAKNTALKYGMLPLPKADNLQNNYRTSPQGAYSSMALLSNIGNRLEIATAVMETLSEQSYLLVRPAYYEVAYKSRYASGSNTAVLFDKIMDGITFNFGSVYSNVIGNPVWKIRGNLQGSSAAPSDDLGKVYTTYESSFKKLLTKLTDELESLQ